LCSTITFTPKHEISTNLECYTTLLRMHVSFCNTLLSQKFFRARARILSGFLVLPVVLVLSARSRTETENPSRLPASAKTTNTTDSASYNVLFVVQVPVPVYGFLSHLRCGTTGITCTSFYTNCTIPLVGYFQNTTISIKW
jgi:hypothetical protein